MDKAHPASRVEDAFNAQLAGRLDSRGWVRRILPFAGYGGEDFANVYARVIMSQRRSSGGDEPAEPPVRRGWRAFFSAPLPAVTVTVRLGAARVEVVSDRGGYIEASLRGHGLKSGWHDAELELDGEIATEQVQIIAADTPLGIVSDIDDTCLVTMLPRPMLAAYNSFVLQETARRVVPGMPAMYRSLQAHHPGTPIIYLSTGAWNSHGTLERFLRRHGYPAGALLLTDWGPTEDSWFRSGQQHKRTTLERLTNEFPNTRWLLVGDDGQHDPGLYDEVASAKPDSVAAIAIRQLTPAQQLLSSGTPIPADEGDGNHQVPVLEGPDGYVLHRLVTKALRRLEHA
ncbi:App1 family protein [Demetria terragena]|uniref:App1 family protein n=1 Tax=Demetria terragena TaxID=63959 RepID=UPI000379DFCF|nr:phosphatase domain-containing protein [Demetria terragena]